ncbi:MAG: polyprenyl synthetase family protein [bacterium]|nr:polyprenyl synthetase family protein [bacterium]
MKPAFLKGIKLERSGLKDAVIYDLSRTEELMRDRLGSDVAYIRSLNEKVFAQGGKRLRPALHILAAGSPGSSSDAVLLTAAVLEMIHTATLLHDDVVDGSHCRRGKPTLNASDGAGSAVLMGDFIYSRAITLMLAADLRPIIDLMATTVHQMSVGELMQVGLRNGRIPTQSEYFDVINEKTARLIETSCRSGAILGDFSENIINAYALFGRNIGLAFQVVDDILDYIADTNTLGKPVGSDVAEKTLTLPFLLAHDQASPAGRTELENMLHFPGENREKIVNLVLELGGVEAAKREARLRSDEARKNLSALQQDVDGETIIALEILIDYILGRNL